jgi:hypothetical protein
MGGRILLLAIVFLSTVEATNIGLDAKAVRQSPYGKWRHAQVNKDFL